MKYIEKGKCIFCGKTEPDVSFNNKPHTTPKSLGSTRIGFDVCDDCNHFFGAPDKSMVPYIAVETSVKEIFGLIRFMLQLSREGHEEDRLKSIYFSFWRSQGKLTIKQSFQSKRSFSRVFIKQFKRGLYELFLQEYHKATMNALDPKFDRVRRYARYGVGDLPVWHLQMNMMFVEKDLSEPKLQFTEPELEQMETYGFYTFVLWGFCFYLEVTPRAELSREIFLENESKRIHVGGFVVRNLVQLDTIDDIDYTLRMLYGRNSE